MKIYLIDDDAEEADLFKEALRRIDGSIDLVWYDDAMEALNNLVEEAIDPELIFLDLNIPKVSGKELLKLLRMNTKTNALPVVIYSTSISTKDIEETSAYGVRAYFQKPEDFQTLRMKLNELLLN